MTQVGKNTPNSALLRSFIDRLENLAEQKKAITEDEKAVKAEAAAAGFNVKQGINYVLKVRKMKPHDRQEAESVRDIYMHAMGMDAEPPLFRQIGAMVRDAAAREQVLEALKAVVPANGEIIMKSAEGKPVRLFRDKEGKAQVEDYVEPSAAEAHNRSVMPLPKSAKEVPNCTTDEAEQLGRVAAKENLPVIDNPFPFGDERRPRWDLGWRKETGNDGMEPDDKKP